MPKVFLTVAAIALTAASAASAAPRMGSFSAMADGGASSASTEAEATPFLAFLLGMFDIRLASTKATAPSNDAAHQSGNANYQCKDSEKSDADEAAEAKSPESAGPEPVYLAF